MPEDVRVSKLDSFDSLSKHPFNLFTASLHYSNGVDSLVIYSRL